MATAQDAKERLDLIIRKSRVDMYKPIQIAEVLYHCRVDGNVDCSRLADFKNRSIQWRNVVTQRLLGKSSSSSAQFQHNLWSDNAMTPELLTVLDRENIASGGLVEKYIYARFAQKQSTVGAILEYVRSGDAASFDLGELLMLFESQPGLRRSIDKAYEIVTYCVIETVVEGLDAKIEVTTAPDSAELLELFADLAGMVLLVTPDEPVHSEPARVYRAGKTNAADRGLDMWCNFGPAIQVKHLTLNPDLAESIVCQVDADRVVLVCRSADRPTVQVILQQLGWGSRVSGIITERELNSYYDRCLRGPFSATLGPRLMELLEHEFDTEFPQGDAVSEFIEERGYDQLTPGDSIWDAHLPLTE